MMARVSLGHTGRPMQPARWVEASFLALNAAAALRVVGPLLAPDRYALWLEISAGLWVLTFLVFLFYHAPMLLRPRPDGQPG
jgi:uncharacterized protein involved in response to NO